MVWLQSQLIITVLPIITFHPPFGGEMKNIVNTQCWGAGVAGTDTVPGNVSVSYLLSLRFGIWGTVCC